MDIKIILLQNYLLAAA